MESDFTTQDRNLHHLIERMEAAELLAIPGIKEILLRELASEFDSPKMQQAPVRS